MSVSVRDLAHRDTPAADCLHSTCTPADGGGTPPSPIQQEEEEGVIPELEGDDRRRSHRVAPAAPNVLHPTISCEEQKAHVKHSPVLPHGGPSFPGRLLRR